MKEKNANIERKFLARKQNGWVSRLFRKKPKPLMSRKGKREARGLAAASRRACLGLAIGVGVGVALFALVLSIPPQISPEQLAASVKAQMVRRRALDPSTKSTALPPAKLPLTTPNPEETVVTSATNSSALATQQKRQYLPIGFEKLSGFPFWVTDQMMDGKDNAIAASLKTMGQIPGEVKALNEKQVSLRGFMLPMKYEGKLTTEFLLLKNQSLCCYGVPPKITEWVNVRMAGKGAKAIMDVPVTVCGTFHVGDLRENGDLVGIYRLEAERVYKPDGNRNP
ncbi:MAG TPA: DUF3299 domain-containing protein [Candidatus Acidoferrum sp.]|jgi:hypothetical protein|nr:DUF3299 domain-containing protein [Candidatus Acidoferrum sp.]